MAVVEMPPPPINWADDALADAPWEPAQALEAPPLSPAIPKQPPVDLRIEATLANATVKQTTISAIIGGGCCGYVAGWCLLSSLVRLGTVAGATTAGLLVVLPPPPLAANTLWFDVDGDPRGTARRTAYSWARACAAFVLVARDSLKRLWQSLWRRYGPALEGVSNQIVTFDFLSHPEADGPGHEGHRQKHYRVGRRCRPKIQPRRQAQGSGQNDAGRHHPRT